MNKYVIQSSIVQFSFSTSPKIFASRHNLVILWGRICVGQRGRSMLWDETRPGGTDDIGGCTYEGSSWVAPYWAGAYASSYPQRSSLSLGKLFEPSFCGWTLIVCSSLYRLVSSRLWHGSYSSKPGAVIFTQQFEHSIQKNFGWKTSELCPHPGLAREGLPCYSRAVPVLINPFPQQGLWSVCSWILVAREWGGPVKRTSAEDKCFYFTVHWCGLGRKDTGSLLEFTNGRKIWLEDIPKILIAHKVLGSRHSLHTGLLRKGFMAPISSVYAPGDQVWFTEATLPCQHNNVLIFGGKKSSTYLWVSIQIAHGEHYRKLMFSISSAASAYLKAALTGAALVHAPSTFLWQLERRSAEVCGTNMPSWVWKPNEENLGLLELRDVSCSLWIGGLWFERLKSNVQTVVLGLSN